MFSSLESLQRFSRHSFCSSLLRKVQAMILLDLLPVHIGIVFKWKISASSRSLYTFFRFDSFEINVENQ